MYNYNQASSLKWQKLEHLIINQTCLTQIDVSSSRPIDQ